MKWTVGITTCPRVKGYYLDRTIDSLYRAGWNEVFIFAEPNSIIPSKFRGCVIERRKQYGDWSNWATGLYELLLSEPDTDMFFMLEDDVVLCNQAKSYLEYSIPKLGEFATVSLYTPSIYAKRSRCFHNECHSDKKLRSWSTVTIMMKREQVIDFFSDYDVQLHRFKNMEKVLKPGSHASYGRGFTSLVDMVGNTIKDVVIGDWAYKKQLPTYYHSPALAEHIGEFSTLTEDKCCVENGRMTNNFVGEEFDISDWLLSPVAKLNTTKIL